MKYIIVQAGGKGTRLGYLTKNKPKCLTPIENLPMIFYLFRKYPDKHFIIIADYKEDVLREYLRVFANVKYLVVKASAKGTCGGIKQALDLVPDNERFMLIWSDLILTKEFELPEGYRDIDTKACKDYIGLSTTFPCRWKYRNGEFSEEKSTKYGVAGFFLFRNKSRLDAIPENGELVRWMKDNGMKFDTVNLAGTREFGLLEEYEKLKQMRTRPFNRISIHNDILIKEPVDEQGKILNIRECSWYEKAKELNIAGIPRIISTDPLQMEFIRGRNVYECDVEYSKKRKILENIINMLRELHESDKIKANQFSMKEAYFNKTIQRLSKIEYLVPFAREKSIIVNGRKCRNVFYYINLLEKRLEQLKVDKFSFIHGDCTFSNIMINGDSEPIMIDPRGYFGFTEFYGDERYDWAKLYYSIIGNYDQFNLKKFSLDIGGRSVVDGDIIDGIEDNEVRLTIESNGWENLEQDFFSLTGTNEYEIKLLHAVIWLSLTTYAWQDYDSICGAFYNGLYYLEEVL